MRFGDRSSIDSASKNNLPDCSSIEGLETNITTSRSLSATGSDSSHNLPWYDRDHGQDTSSHAYLQSPPVQNSATNDLMHPHNPFDCTALGDTTFPQSSDTSAAKAEMQQFAPIIPPQTLAHPIHLDSYHVPKPLYHEPAADQQHAFSACTNGALLPETSHPAPHSPRVFSSTLNSACLGPLSLHPSKVPSLQDPSRGLPSTITDRGFADRSFEFNGNPLPTNDMRGFNNSEQHPALLTEPRSGFQNLGGSSDQVPCTGSSVSVNRYP